MTELTANTIAELQQKANNGNAQAQFDLALCYINGTDIEKNKELALEWSIKAAENGHVEAQFTLGMYYFLGVNDSQTAKLINKWVLGFTSGKTNDLTLAVNLSIGAAFKANANLAFLWFKKAAAQNHAVAQFWLGQCYLNGWGTEKDDILAFECFKHSAEQGYADAYYDLALCYRDALSIVQDYQQFFYWITKATEEENVNPEAYLFLGDLYDFGHGVEQNKKLACQWYEKAADKGIAEAQFRLACCYENGDGVDKSIELANTWYKKAAEQGYIDADIQFMLAKRYLLGSNGIKVDHDTGMQCLIDAVQNHHTEAKTWFEDVYLDFTFPCFSGRKNIDQCYCFAFDWLTENISEDPTDLEVNFGLGVLYAFGKGVEKNTALATCYFDMCMESCSEHYVREDDNFTDIIYKFSEIYKDVVKGKINTYYFEQLAPFFIERKATHQGVKKIIPILWLLEYAFLIKNREFNQLDELLNALKDSESILPHNALQKRFKKMGLISIKHAKQIDLKNKALEKSQKELEEMMSMFSHKFRSPLDTIIYNTTHENQLKIYTEAAQTMQGLLDVFSIISTDSEILKEKMKQDHQGNSRLSAVFLHTLDMIILHLLSASSVEKIQQHYMSYAKAHVLCDTELSYKTWYDNFYELEQKLQTEWEQSYAQLITQSTKLQTRLSWLETHFFKLELLGFDKTQFQFKEYGVIASFLTILLNEILVNAFKYYASSSKQAVTLEWIEREGFQVLVCRNPSAKNERTIIKGSHKGHAFLSALARKTGSQFIKPILQDDFVIEFGIPNELLLNKGER